MSILLEQYTSLIPQDSPFYEDRSARDFDQDLFDAIRLAFDFRDKLAGFHPGVFRYVIKLLDY